jgi:hypothetical protein
LYWGPDGEFTKTVYNHPVTDVPDMRSAPDNRSYTAYAAIANKITQVDKFEFVCFPTVVSDDEESTTSEGNTSAHSSESDGPVQDDNVIKLVHTPEQEYIEENLTDFTTLEDEAMNSPNIIEDDVELPAATPQAELLRYHYRLGHISFFKLKQMAFLGLIPRRLYDIKPPKCAACCFGKAIKRPWRTKSQPGRIHQCSQPGECVSVDQMESSTLGFIGQLKGALTKRRYKAATVFVDHFSDFTFIHLQESMTSQETIKAKQSFEAFARQHGVQIRHYHCDNGRFAENEFLDAVKKSQQTISFCGTNSHHQNGRAEKRIRDLRESARTMLLHAIARWPEAVTTRLWPYALRYAAEVRNRLVDKKDGSSPLERFSSVKVNSNLKDLHTFGCPVYALDSRLAAGNSIPHWHPRARVGLYLGPSPRHARTVGLVLNLQTGLVSP